MNEYDDNMCDDTNEDGDYVVPTGDCSRECMHACRTPICSMGCICGCQGKTGLRAELVAQLRQKGPRFSALAARLTKVQLQAAKGRKNPARNPRFQAHARRQEALRLAAVQAPPMPAGKQLGARQAAQPKAGTHQEKAGAHKKRHYKRRVQRVDLATAPDSTGFSWGKEGGKYSSPGDRHTGSALAEGSAHALYGAEVAGIMARDHPKVRKQSTHHFGGDLGANLKSISHRYYLREVAFGWELTKETIHLPLGCLQGGQESLGHLASALKL